MKYVVTWLALLALTAASLLSSYLGAGLPVGVGVALAKATLVAAIFMRLAEDRFTNRAMFAFALLFVAIFVALVAADPPTR